MPCFQYQTKLSRSLDGLDNLYSEVNHQRGQISVKELELFIGSDIMRSINKVAFMRHKNKFLYVSVNCSNALKCDT